MPPTFPAVNGITFKFGSDFYTATQISVSRSAAEFDVTSTKQAAGELNRYRLSEVENCEIKVDWIGLKVPKVDDVYEFTLSSGLNHTGTKALCTGLTITAQAGELIKGSATFKVSYD